MQVSFERRNFMRFDKELKTGIRITHTSAEVEGVTKNLSQGGALISTPSWSAFQKDEQAVLHLVLPPEITGQDSDLVLNGPAVVKRIDKDNEVIAVQFLKELRTFEVIR